jgi:putative PIN family toxin of toxin-antitoxin system
MFEIVIDTCVLVSALKSKLGASFKILSLLQSGKFKIHLSTALVLEYEDVLKRPELGLSFTIQEIDKLLDVLCLIGEKQKIFYQWRPLLSEEKDNFVGELAINAQVQTIVTHNVKDFQNITKFGIKVITPKEFLQLIGELK